MPGLLSQASNQAAGLTRGLLYGGLGAPVDLANMALLGAGGQRPVGGSAWLEQKIDPLLSRFIGAPNSGQSVARFVGDVVAPGPGEFAAGSKALQGLLADPATATKIQQMVGGLLGMTAYHGSPHRFGQFRLADDTIGTGEGAQAYGHGLYFAEDPKVAGSYKSTFEKDKHLTVSKGGKDIYGDALTDKHLDAIKYLEAGAKDAGEFKHNAAYYAKKRTQDPEVLALIDELKDAKIGYKSHASLYTVDIPDEQIGKMLDWDKPLSEQPASVQKAWADYWKDQPADGMFKNIDGSLEPDVTGKMIYEHFGEVAHAGGIGADHLRRIGDARKRGVGSQQAASDYLKSFGIPGIRYLDGRSRSAGEGSRNFVVFDDSILRILNRE